MLPLRPRSPARPRPGLLREVAAGGLLCTACWPATALDLSLQAEHWRYDARESTPSGFVLNRDSGVLRGGTLALHAAVGAWRPGLALQALDGTLRYDGRTQIGLPLQTRTGLQWRRAAWTLEPAASVALGPLALQPRLSLARLRLERAIAATPVSLPTTETLQATTLGLGATATWTAGTLAWQAGLDGRRPLRQRLEVDTFGVLDPYALRPQSRWSTQVLGAVAWTPHPGWTLRLGARREALNLGASQAALVTADGRPAAVSAYPGSRQRLRGWSLELLLEP
ncbi:hypothetical protein ACPOLB_20770 [Rubrivivax sp. RP6-9]|uniref:hypothetical protein n=1 Tax=Rubrivivax sp. RP6-9 TaxID=3415750 RepID=UPI003CC6D0CD